MTAELEERVRRLEAFRYSAIGFINAQNTLISDLWCNFILNNEPDKVRQTMLRLREHWLADSDKSLVSTEGVDAAHLDLISQQYREALELLIATMEQKLKPGPTSGLGGKS
jgi:hypothetical protein